MFITKYHVIGSQGSRVGFLVAALIVPMAAVQAAEMLEPKRVPPVLECYPPYQQAWGQGRPFVDTKAVRAYVEQLGSEIIADRTKAIAALETGAGDRLGYDEQGSPESKEKALGRWRRYAHDLETAVNEWVPSLIATPSRSNCGARGLAAAYIGLRAPHPAFLPLLREIVNNPTDNHNDRCVRAHAIVAISQIRHDGVVEYLIDHLDSDLALWSWEQLRKLTRPWWGPGDDEKEAMKEFVVINRRLQGEDWVVLKKRYQQWWANNKANFIYDRGRVLGGG